MLMRSYWAKIILGALAIFGAGMLVRGVVGQVRHKVHVVVDTAEPITIPLPLGIVPFKLDGVKLGRLQSLTLLRDSPKGITSIQLKAELSDSVSFDRLSECMLQLDHPTDLNDRTTFKCVKSDTAGLNLVPYGEVTINPGEHVLTLLVLANEVEQIRSEATADRLENDADSIANAASELADSITQVNMDRADSIREDAMQRADSIREAAFRLADSIRQAKTRGN